MTAEEFLETFAKHSGFFPSISCIKLEIKGMDKTMWIVDAGHDEWPNRGHGETVKDAIDDFHEKNK